VTFPALSIKIAAAKFVDNPAAVLTRAPVDTYVSGEKIELTVLIKLPVLIYPMEASPVTVLANCVELMYPADPRP
jgi:hypothetical protein